MTQGAPTTGGASLEKLLAKMQAEIWDLKRRLTTAPLVATPNGAFTDSWISATVTSDTTNPSSADLSWTLFGSNGSDLSLASSTVFEIAKDGWYQPFLAVAAYQTTDAEGSMQVIHGATSHGGLNDYMDGRIRMAFRPTDASASFIQREAVQAITLPVSKYLAGDQISWEANTNLRVGSVTIVGNRTFGIITRVG